MPKEKTNITQSNKLESSNGSSIEKNSSQSIPLPLQLKADHQSSNKNLCIVDQKGGAFQLEKDFHTKLGMLSNKNK